MTQQELEHLYFEWICSLVYPDDDQYYHKLFEHLFRTEFIYILPMDANRKSDGEDLRYRFSYERDIPQAVVANLLDVRPSSVLEMMVALAIRCEESIMDDPIYGNRTGQWFWEMIVALGLGKMNDLLYDEQYVTSVLYRFMNREYQPNGIGGLFHIECGVDIRGLEIWKQMNWYLDTLV